MGRKGFPEKDMNASLDRMRRTYERMDEAITAAAVRGCSVAIPRSPTSP